MTRTATVGPTMEAACTTDSRDHDQIPLVTSRAPLSFPVVPQLVAKRSASSKRLLSAIEIARRFDLPTDGCKRATLRGFCWYTASRHRLRSWSLGLYASYVRFVAMARGYKQQLLTTACGCRRCVAACGHWPFHAGCRTLAAASLPLGDDKQSIVFCPIFAIRGLCPCAATCRLL